MNRRSLLALLAASGASFPASAAPPALTYNPAHYQNNDPIWDVLNQARVTADMKRGLFTAEFPSELKAREDTVLRIAGFMLPLEASSQSAHFVLVRRNTGCPFCPPNAPTEAVEVFSDRRVAYTGEEIAVTGRFKLVSNSAEGLFFKLDTASAAPTHLG